VGTIARELGVHASCVRRVPSEWQRLRELWRIRLSSSPSAGSVDTFLGRLDEGRCVVRGPEAGHLTCVTLAPCPAMPRTC